MTRLQHPNKGALVLTGQRLGGNVQVAHVVPLVAFLGQSDLGGHLEDADAEAEDVRGGRRPLIEHFVGQVPAITLVHARVAVLK